MGFFKRWQLQQICGGRVGFSKEKKRHVIVAVDVRRKGFGWFLGIEEDGKVDFMGSGVGSLAKTQSNTSYVGGMAWSFLRTGWIFFKTMSRF